MGSMNRVMNASQLWFDMSLLFPFVRSFLVSSFRRLEPKEEIFSLWWVCKTSSDMDCKDCLFTRLHDERVCHFPTLLLKSWQESRTRRSWRTAREIKCRTSTCFCTKNRSEGAKRANWLQRESDWFNVQHTIQISRLCETFQLRTLTSTLTSPPTTARSSTLLSNYFSLR